MLQKNTEANGYQKLHLNSFKGMETLIEEEVFEQLIPRLIFVKDLKIAGMNELPDEVREQLVNFAAEVIEQH